ncbi:MAG: NAD(P)/FAD-dependent oxidoreductase [Pyrinomonadaceae bacterium]
MKEREPARVVVLGAGPAGLTAAYELGKANVASVVLEKGVVVGGLARTGNYKGFRFDIGGHRFYTKVKAVEAVWHEVLPEADFPPRQRLSRIYYDQKFFHYPLRVPSLLASLGAREGLLILASYLRARLRPHRAEETFEQWVTNRFGGRLYEKFFKTYTEKVWGIPCAEITADWAAQRIRGLSLSVLVKDLLLGRRGGGGDNKGAIVKTLINEFHYPRRGPGMMWEAMAERVSAQGGEVRLGARVEKIRRGAAGVESVEFSSAGRRETIKGSHFISTIPARELIEQLDPAAPADVRAAAASLRYRDFLTVVLIVNRAEVFPDNWIYVHDANVRMGRVQNFKNWSPDMVPDQSKTCLGLEYFCFEGDGLWTMSDAALVELGKCELARLGLARAEEVEDGTVVRVPKAYPVYDTTYRQALAVVREFLRTLPNLQLVGRNGMHRYNNQDHSMLTAMLAAENVLGASHDLWEVNTDHEYQEEFGAQTGADAPSPLAQLAATQPRVPARVKARAVAAESEA